jgi:hypothetical protein
MVLAATASPSTEALRLGRELAGQGTLTALLPLIEAKETEELIAAHPELNGGEKAQLRTTARTTYESGLDKLLASTGRAYAERLSISDLRRLVAFNRTAAARRYRAAMPQAIAETMRTVGPMDFKGDVIKAFCKQTGKLCDAK